MNPDQNNVLYAILEEMKENRAETKENRTVLLNLVQRISILETIPARMIVVEQKAADYEQNKYKAVGALLTITALASFSAWPTVHHLWHLLFG